MKRRAFSLIEVLVVIGIIGLLVAILLPVISKARVKARITQCLNNEHQLFVAISTFAGEHGGHAPGAGVCWDRSQESDQSKAFLFRRGPGIGQPVASGTGTPGWAKNVAPPLLNTEPPGILSRLKLTTQAVSECPEIDAVKEQFAFDDDHYYEAYHYQFNRDFVGEFYDSVTSEGLLLDFIDPGPAATSQSVYPLSQCRNSSQTLLIICGPSRWDYFSSCGVSWIPPSNGMIRVPAQGLPYSVTVWPMHDSGGVTHTDSTGYFSNPNTPRTNSNRRVVVTYVDGHGEAVEPEFGSPVSSQGLMQDTTYRIGNAECQYPPGR